MKTDSTRRIVMSPGANPNTNQVVIKNNRTPVADDAPAPPDVQPEIAVVINKPRSLSLTEPKDGYPGSSPPNAVNTALLTAQGVTYTPSVPGGDDGTYNPVFDLPFDMNPVVQTDSSLRSDLTENGIIENFRRVHLQRLANPLLPWNKFTNPYLTVDSMVVPLTKFNGVEKQTDMAPIFDPISKQNPTALVTLEARR